ncbi:MAG TPA: hypothetical protein VM327_08620 [Candidatus Thermoplasmatota archaeon]|nr:hypothetical protein [Candidatus Thermoplasmatota archaeon]
MLNGPEIDDIAAEISRQTDAQRTSLDLLLKDVESFQSSIRTIQPCEMTSLALVGVDAGVNVLKFDPFLIQVVRVVDSKRRSLLRQVVSPEMSREQLSRAQFNPDKTPKTPIGRLMQDLGCNDLWDLCVTVLPDGKEASRGWVRDFRILAEWAVLYDEVLKAGGEFDRLFVFDSLLRNKMFVEKPTALFIDMWNIMKDHIEKVESETTAKIRIAGFMETTQVLNRYRLALSLKGIFQRPEPCYARVPQSIENDSYKWEEWARTPGDEKPGGEKAKFAAGKLHFAKFGREPNAPVYCIDLPWFQSGQEKASETMAFLLRDAQVGFPIPFIPASLQRAREYATIDGLEGHILQRKVLDAVEGILPTQLRERFSRYEFENPGDAHVHHD